MARGDKNLADAPYLLTHADGAKTLNQKWVVEGGQTVAWVKANIVPSLFTRYNLLGWSDAEVMAMTLLPAYWNDWVLSGQSPSYAMDNVITSNNGVTVPAGVYKVNYPCIRDGGEFYGAGTGFAGTPGGLVSMNTNLVYDRAGWIGGLGGTHLDGKYTVGGTTHNIVFDQANLIQDTTWQVLSGGRSYTESGYVDGFRLTGDNGDWYNPNQRRSNGLGLWDQGETSGVGRIFAETFNGSGCVCVRGTPATIKELSSFQNAWSGIELIGTELNTININTLSGDDNPAMVGMSAGYGRGAGGTLNVNLTKSESGKRTPNKGQILLWQRDPSYGLINFSDVQCDMNNLFLDAMIVIKNNTSAAGQIVHAQLRGWNCRTLVHDVTSGIRWAAQSYRPERITYSFRNGVARLQDEATGQALTSSTVNATDRLGLVANNGVFDYAAGTPPYDIYGGVTPPPPPPACSWIVGPYPDWSTIPCVNGLQTRTRSVTSSVVGCTPSEPMPPTSESQSCAAPPPPATPLYSLNNFNNSTATTSIDIPNVAGVRRIVLTNVTFNLPSFSYQSLLQTVGNTQGLRAIPQETSGRTCRFRIPGTNTYAGQSVPQIVINTLYPTLELTFPNPITVDRLLAAPGTGGALLLQCQNISMYSS